MRPIVTLLLTFCFSVLQIRPAFPATVPVGAIQTINNNIDARVYSFKKTKHYVAVEVGFTNPTGDFIEFTPKEIYLDDEVKYSKPPLSMNDIQSIEGKKPGMSLLPLALGVGLGIATLGTGITGNNGASKALGIAALSMGGAYVLTKGLENQVKQNRLIGFENNSFGAIKRLPPGMTLGGFLFFPATKEPKSITIIARSKSGHYEKKVFELVKMKETKRSRRGMRRDA